MSEFYEVRLDENGNPKLDKNGNWIFGIVAGCVDDEPKETIWRHKRRLEEEKKKAEEEAKLERRRKREERKRKKEEREKKAQAKATTFPKTNATAGEEVSENSQKPTFLNRTPIMFNDMGQPITMQGGYSSEDILELYGDRDAQAPENE